MESRYAINLETLNFETTMDLYNLDKSYIGTDKYMGLAYFWNYEYRHTLRGLSIYNKKRIHNLGLKKGINFETSNKEAWHFIAKLLNCDVNRLIDIEEIKQEENNNES